MSEEFDLVVLAALDEAIETDPWVQFREELGCARAYWVAKTVGREIGAKWDYGPGRNWAPSESAVARVVAALKRLAVRGLVAKGPRLGSSRGWTITVEGDELLAELEVGARAE